MIKFLAIALFLVLANQTFAGSTTDKVTDYTLKAINLTNRGNSTGACYYYGRALEAAENRLTCSSKAMSPEAKQALAKELPSISANIEAACLQ